MYLKSTPSKKNTWQEPQLVFIDTPLPNLKILYNFAIRMKPSQGPNRKLNISVFTQGGAKMDLIWMILGAVVVLYILIMIPFQYRNIAATKEELKKTKKTHNETYEDMSFEEQQLQYNLQGNLLNLPSTLIATLIYKLRHRDK